MRTIVIIGGSKGIGNAIVNLLVESTKIINISRSEPKSKHQNITHYTCNVLTDDLPDIDTVNALIY